MIDIAKCLLPKKESDWYSFLRDYFCDKDVLISRDGEKIKLEIEWSSDALRYIDPNLSIGLDWWGGGVSYSSMWAASRRNGKVHTMLYDTWTLHGWSKWLETFQGSVNDVVILHVDDHRDLSTPRLVILDNIQVDAITKKPVSIRDPSSIAEAISSGAIGIGSFLTPFVREFPQITVRHLCQPPKNTADVFARLVPTTQSDVLLHPNAVRPGIKVDTEKCIFTESFGYFSTNNLDTWSQGLEGRPVLLHIDMDYFNNRYDGDSDWKTFEEHLDPNLSSILVQIDVLTDVLASSKADIQDVAIAYSPGFFPAEFWAECDVRLRSGIAKIA